LYGIDTPEYGQDYSDRAGSFTRKYLLDKIVSVELMDVDKYGRTVALIQSQGRLINRELVRAGMAWVYPWFCREEPLCSELKNLEGKARKSRRGLWQLEDPVAPWDWKKMNKQDFSVK
jgi:endonuclease YncB( thermonuclease family)